MEIVLTVIGVLVFFGGSYFIGNSLVGNKYDTLQDKITQGFFGMLVMVVTVLIVGVVSVCVHEGVVRLIN